MLLVVVLLISGSIHQSLQASLTAKCCPEELKVEETGHFQLDCVRDENCRLQVWSNSNSFLKDGIEGECIDSDGKDVSIYQVNNSFVSSKAPYSSEVFPKCCPLNYAYDKNNHSCSQTKNISQDFLKSQVVQVGFPHICRTITDETFSSLEDADFWIEKLQPGKYCLDMDVGGNYIIRQCHEGMEVCMKKRCFKKCCPDGQSYVAGAHCKDTYKYGLKLDSQPYSKYIQDINDDYEIIYGAGCSRVGLMLHNTINYTIEKNSSFTYYSSSEEQFLEDNVTNLQTYCLEHGNKNNVSGYSIFQCLKITKLPEKFTYTLWAKTISCICLLLTILIYFYLGEVKSSFGKILLNYCIAMICLMITLIVSHLSAGLYQCKIRAYLIVLFSMSCYTWINVMSLDIWWTFGTPKRTIGSDQRRKDLKKFLLYMLYGWGVPLCHNLMILVLDYAKILPDIIQPYIGKFKCFFDDKKGNYARVFWFILPQLIIQIINTVLYIRTIIYCIKVKSELIRMNDSSRISKVTADKEKLGLIVKLAVIMGVVWILETSSAFFPDLKSYSQFTMIFEIIIDNIICLQGVFIFLIFICKTKTYNHLRIKLGLGMRRLSNSTSVTQSSQLIANYPIGKRRATLNINDGKM